MKEAIKNYRIKADLSWKDLAEMIGIEPGYAWQVFNGHAKPGPRTAFKIQRFYDAHRAEIDAVTTPTGESR